LEGPPTPVEIEIVRKRCPAALNSFGKHLAGHLCDFLDLALAEPGPASCRPHPRTKKNLASVNVTDPGNQALVEQRSFNRPPRSSKPIKKPRVRIKGLRSQLCELIELFHLAQADHPESTGIDEVQNITMIKGHP
jgi:hypothetical protein